ncbi:putative FmdB family regulatory protein [Nitrospina gracilis]|uniref:FmdB family zinc ribbon protein n=1 Tax=Nitrospina sp. Nb-3 TaxID=2940485 RepID=UPI001F1F4BBC|nr:FmdB family zinc ribbon protein [Nitrospina sp. Nb-3]MCF8724071.1 putative FmdB family regulatory protein [Nitrospina sp. Nb-3]
MPQYDHTCKKCKHNFVVEMRISEVGNKEVTCPKCKKSKDVERNVTNTSYWSESVDRYRWDK